jgi:hypothetical protein
VSKLNKKTKTVIKSQLQGKSLSQSLQISTKNTLIDLTKAARQEHFSSPSHTIPRSQSVGPGYLQRCSYPNSTYKWSPPGEAENNNNTVCHPFHNLLPDEQKQLIKQFC